MARRDMKERYVEEKRRAKGVEKTRGESTYSLHVLPSRFSSTAFFNALQLFITNHRPAPTSTSSIIATNTLSGSRSTIRFPTYEPTIMIGPSASPATTA